MKVIVCKESEKLGKAGDVIKVRDGYARNFLIPSKLVREYTPQNIKWFERQKAIEKNRFEKQRKEFEELADTISKLSCTIPVKVSEDGRLFGSVTALDIARVLESSEDINSTKINNRFSMMDCSNCGYRFDSKKVKKVCDNCFACLGCEVYVCPKCGSEVEVVSKRVISHLKNNTGNHIE